MSNTPNILPVDVYVQYQNAPKFNQLLRELTDYLTIPIDQFYSEFFNLATCTTQGLNNWGRILNQPRSVEYYDYDYIMGFDTGITPSPLGTGYPQNFDNGNFFSFEGSSSDLDDATYRALLQLTYFRYVIDCTVGACARVMTYYAQLSDPANKCAIIDGDKIFTYAFNYTLSGWEIVLFQQLKLLPRPAGIDYIVTWT